MCRIAERGGLLNAFMSAKPDSPSARRCGLSRRDFFRILAGSAVCSALPRLARAFDQSAYPFSEVLSARSGISWTHTAGRSKEKFLPEISGPGCAFLDYDN